MRNTVRLGLVAVVAATLLVPTAAPAQENDPEKGSPSGTVYEIPLESARDDAAPPAPSDGEDAAPPAPPAPAAAPAEEPTSPIRSENGLGSSAVVPGAAPRERERSKPRRERKRETRAPARPAQPVTTARAADDGGAAERLVSATTAVGGEPSTTRAYLLIALAARLAVGLGAAARRAR